MKKYLYTVLALALFLALAFPVPVSAAEPAYTIPTFSITGVVRDSTVTIYTYNFPAGDSFDVLMNVMGTRGVGGYVVDTVNSGSGGSFSKTFTIPAQLYGQPQIAIRLQSKTGSGYYAFNWFWNNTVSFGIGGGSTTVKPAGPAPTFSVTVVNFDTSVTVRTAHLPANDDIRFRMAPYGNGAVNGEIVGTFSTGTGGIQEFNLTIPPSLVGEDYIAIRMESVIPNYFAYGWFANQAGLVNPPPGSSGTGGGIGGGYYGGSSSSYPVFYITSVVRDNTVTIQTSNLPANDNFDVLMGPMGTRGVNGTYVTSVASGTGGTKTFTFNIPPALYGSNQISIRLQSNTGSGYYAYNWFYNNTTGTGGQPPPPPPPNYTGIPTFKVCEVAKNGTATIVTSNFPPGQTFTVTMGQMYTAGINGFVVGTINSGDGSSQRLTFPIPPQLADSYRISMRAQTAHAYPFFAYNWFFNNTAVVC